MGVFWAYDRGLVGRQISLCGLRVSVFVTTKLRLWHLFYALGVKVCDVICERTID